MKLVSSSPDSDKKCLFRTFAKTVIMQFPCLPFTRTILLNGWFTWQWITELVTYCMSPAQVATRLIGFMSQSNHWSVGPIRKFKALNRRRIIILRPKILFISIVTDESTDSEFVLYLKITKDTLILARSWIRRALSIIITGEIRKENTSDKTVYWQCIVAFCLYVYGIHHFYQVLVYDYVL